MDLDLPILDIVEDIEEIMDDSKVISEEDFEKALLIEEEKKQPFVKKTVVAKKKKELSDKQIAHLNKIRGMALEKRQTKAAAKKEAIDKVKEEVSIEHKPKYYKPKPKKTKEEKDEERELKKKYKKQTMEVVDEVVEEIKEVTPEEFVPKHKAVIKEKKEKQLFNQQDSFNHFMGNMESYLKLREEHDKSKAKQQPKQQPIKKVSQPTPVILQPIEENPFSNYFG